MIRPYLRCATPLSTFIIDFSLSLHSSLLYLISCNGFHFNSTSFVEMVEFCANGLGIPILISVDGEGFANVLSLCLSIRFGLQDSFVWVEHKVFDPITLVVSHTLPEVFSMSDDGLTIWKLNPSRYRVYGLTSFKMAVHTQLLTSCRSSYCIMTAPPMVRVKVEPRVQTVIDLSESEGDVVPQQPHLLPIPYPPFVCKFPTPGPSQFFFP